ncbi:GBS Bsp-like repeat-containing protein [Intestinimonas butyriciproducens]|uniref:Phosphoglycerol transferase MdoB-like AlkP superfamily enzyme n=1 Tax=Intestinimonas butyriciproducens TaxID=1297617 RepID=A0A2U1CC41_9FIRM|nr:GBS Bsp-like repeat-containing protein [Intestinimonas butyriciproducens]MCR1906199.1 GBS Bsp-like repeat-containing protein [Intestinimonas butyriciproducens]PVY58489.1 phosphoglycerol transferase MdoB-like AlkP superfamily enzyme [Intestinimonas butyriciproducens]QBB65509.1 N-acetylmuramoyl-L-alanine amidase [Intestinimonas butyriciproducens]
MYSKTNDQHGRIKQYLPLAIKYGFSIIITFYTYFSNKDPYYFALSLLELCAIILLSNILLAYKKTIGHIAHFLLLLIYNLQTIVMKFGGSFTSLIMVTNLAMFRDLKGKFGDYILVAIPLVICTLIPGREFPMKKNAMMAGSALIIVISVVSVSVFEGKYSPVYNLCQLAVSYKDYKNTVSQIENLTSDSMQFYRSGIENGMQKPDELPEKPNVILIFTEGLSRNVILDDRNIMPNVRQFESESLHFENYYNHSFATFRGLIGQLYSGYQFDDLDSNRLISLQSIFKENGYHTSFINTEPSNVEFSDYLAGFQFDDLITGEVSANEAGTMDIYIQDKDAYELLFDTVMDQHQIGQPFFAAIYTFGTHVSLDSPHEQYGDGKDALLNKFYNTDVQFGKFLERFKASELLDDTVIVFTADHATYEDDDFLKTFSEYERQLPTLDKIPLCIYHKGVKAEAFNACGRNSLDLAPTVLDYLDMSAPNYFLGSSLFASIAETGIEYDTIYHHPSFVVSTKGAVIKGLNEEQYADFYEKLMAYTAVKGSDEIAVQLSEKYLSGSVSENCSTLNVVLKTDDESANIWFPVWSEENDQDDLTWYKAEYNEAAREWRCTVNLTQHGSKGTYLIHAYTGDTKPEKRIAATSVYVSQYPPYHLEATVSEGGKTVDVSLSQAGDYDEILFPIWSVADDQDDLVWYCPEKSSDGTWKMTVNISDHCRTIPDELIIHVYGKMNDQETPDFLTSSHVNISERVKD